MKSPFTTIFGAIAVIGGAILAACIPGTLPDGIVKPEDIPHWLKITAFLMSVVGGKLAFFFAQDKSKPESGQSSKVATILVLLSFSLFTLSASAQTNSAPIIDKAGEKAAVDAGKAFIAGAKDVSNWDAAPYVTYFPNKVGAETFGGGVYVQYKIKGSENFSAGLGLDWLGRLTMPSGSVTAKMPIDVGRYIGVSNIVITPFAIAGIATPLSGAGGDNGGVSAIAGAGAFIPIKRGVKLFGHETDLSVGYAGVKWLNAGKYDGLHHEFFGNVSF